MWFLYTSDLYISILDINTFIISETTLSNTLFIRKRFKEVLERRMIGPGGYLIFFLISFLYHTVTIQCLLYNGKVQVVGTIPERRLVSVHFQSRIGTRG